MSLVMLQFSFECPDYAPVVLVFNPVTCDDKVLYAKVKSNRTVGLLKRRIILLDRDGYMIASCLVLCDCCKTYLACNLFGYYNINPAFEFWNEQFVIFDMKCVGLCNLERLLVPSALELRIRTSVLIELS